MDARHRPTHRRHRWLSGPTPPAGGRAGPRLAQPQPTPGPKRINQSDPGRHTHKFRASLSSGVFTCGNVIASISTVERRFSEPVVGMRRSRSTYEAGLYFFRGMVQIMANTVTIYTEDGENVFLGSPQELGDDQILSTRDGPGSPSESFEMCSGCHFESQRCSPVHHLAPEE